jgi:hypothetical protein
VADAGDTVAVKVTACPNVDGFGEATRTRDVIALMVNAAPADGPALGGGFTTVTSPVPAAATSAAGIAAVNCVALTNVVVRALPFQFTTAPLTKFVPFTVSVNPAPPAPALEGDSPLIVGLGLLTVNVCAPDVPPPVGGLYTVTCAVPAVAISVTGIRNDNSVLLVNNVVRPLPFQRTTEAAVKPLPVTVTCTGLFVPAVALLGESDVMAGVGLASMVNVSALETPPPRLRTVTCDVPAAARSLAGILAVMDVDETSVVVRSLPLQRTTDSALKPLPLIVSVRAEDPEGACVGESDVIAGVGSAAK